jgi:hypothetical protein
MSVQAESGGIHPPFEFDLGGKVAVCAAWAAMPGMGEFARHYVDEWLLWHRAGCTDTRVCDLAAFMVSAYCCKFLPSYALTHGIGWIEEFFLLRNLRESIPARSADYSPQTMAAMRALRPSIADTHGVKDCDTLLQLALPIEKILVLGGDHRLSVDQHTQLNGYGCRPFPRPEAITFSSSTATSISQYAFDVAERRRQQFVAMAIANGTQAAVSSLAQEVRDGVQRLLGFGADLAEVVIAASGTDSFLIAQGLARLIAARPITTIIVGVEESGSGVKLALQERHFANDTALSDTVRKGQPLSAGGGQERQIDLPVRDPAGGAVPLGALDHQVQKLVEEHVAAGNFVVVHAMNHSKLGYSGPSRALLAELGQRFGQNVCIVVDACQMRLDREEIIEYLQRRMMVIITGSKYFTGPPFSGAILVPEQIVHKVQESGAKFDAGFNAYCAREDLPQRLRAVLSGESRSYNLGSMFRWVAALAEMERYFAIPAILRARAVAHFCGRVEDILLAAPFIELHYGDSCKIAPPGVAVGELSGRRMIFPFFLTYPHGGARKLCSADEVQRIYWLLNQDCSARFPYKNAREFRLLAQMCHIGQPVAVVHRSGIHTAVLRISVGARIFSESYSMAQGKIMDFLIEDEFWQIGVILGKMELLLNALADSQASLGT